MAFSVSGAAAEFVARKYRGLFSEVESVESVGVTAAQLFGNEPERVAVLLVNLSNNTIYIGFDEAVGATRGILLASNGGTYQADVEEDLMLPARAMYALATGAASNLYTLRTVRYSSLEGAEVNDADL